MAYCCIAKPRKLNFALIHTVKIITEELELYVTYIFLLPLKRGPSSNLKHPCGGGWHFYFYPCLPLTQSCIFQNPLGWHSRLNFCNSINETPTLSSQKSRESNTSLATSARHHLHALLCESGGGWHLANCVHLFQLLSTVFSGEIMINNTVWQWPEFESSHSLPTKLKIWIILIS